MMKKRKSKPSQRISPKQERLFYRIVIFLALVALLWVVFAPGSGLFGYYRSRAKLTRLQKDVSLLEKENSRLRTENDRLRNDPVYLEKIAREDYNLLKKNERVIDFSKEKPKTPGKK
ncbi:FtsB family cell division protein [Desulfomarina sp.]